MIPSDNKILNEELTTEIEPSKTYKMDLGSNIINGYCDGLEAVKQADYIFLELWSGVRGPFWRTG